MGTKGKFEPSSLDGHHYFLKIFEERSRITTGIPIRTKGEASDELLKYVATFECQTYWRVKGVRYDGGSEFNRSFQFLEGQGINTTRRTHYTSQYNCLG